MAERFQGLPSLTQERSPATSERLKLRQAPASVPVSRPLILQLYAGQGPLSPQVENFLSQHRFTDSRLH